MANDREVLRLIWDGKIPICFIPDPTEIEVSQHPEPMFLMVSRLTYLPLVTEKVTKHFGRHVNNEHQDEVWFECNGRALKWNCPIGKSLFVSSCPILILLLSSRNPLRSIWQRGVRRRGGRTSCRIREGSAPLDHHRSLWQCTRRSSPAMSKSRSSRVTIHERTKGGGLPEAPRTDHLYNAEEGPLSVVVGTD